VRCCAITRVGRSGALRPGFVAVAMKQRRRASPPPTTTHTLHSRQCVAGQPQPAQFRGGPVLACIACKAIIYRRAFLSGALVCGAKGVGGRCGAASQRARTLRSPPRIPPRTARRRPATPRCAATWRTPASRGAASCSCCFSPHDFEGACLAPPPGYRADSGGCSSRPSRRPSRVVAGRDP
jgi:hypothetical protein